MKPLLSLLVLLTPIVAIAETDSVAGRPIIRVAENQANIITTKTEGAPQLEITVGPDSYGIAQLAKGGTPPFTIIKHSNRLETIFTTVKGNQEIIVMDSDGDGIPETRLTIFRDPSGKTLGATKETISFTFVKTEEKWAEQGAAANP